MEADVYPILYFLPTQSIACSTISPPQYECHSQKRLLWLSESHAQVPNAMLNINHQKTRNPYNAFKQQADQSDINILDSRALHYPDSHFFV